MSIGVENFEADFDSILDDFPTTFEDADENSYTGFKTNISRKNQYFLFGNNNTYQFTIIAKQSDFETIPDEGDLLTLTDPSTGNETNFRIKMREFTSDNVRVKFHLENQY